MRERGGFDLMPEQGTRPVNKYLPPRPKRDRAEQAAGAAAQAEGAIDVLAPLLRPLNGIDGESGNGPGGFWAWVDRSLERL